MHKFAVYCAAVCANVQMCIKMCKHAQKCERGYKSFQDQIQKGERVQKGARLCFSEQYNCVFVCVWAVQSLMDATALISAPATYITLGNEILFKSSIFNQLLCHSFFFFRLCCCWKLSFGDTVVCQLVLGCFLQQVHQAGAWYGAVTRWCNTVLPGAPSGDHEVYPQNAPP